MSQNHSGRVILILVILGLALWLIYPIGTSSPKPNLRPGIDMAGGTSLLYEIKPPEGGPRSTEDLSVRTMEALRKRVDPQGVRNLVWRPQGSNRLEIQMPSTGNAAAAKAKLDAYLEAQGVLEATNIRLSAVTSVIEQESGDQRAKDLDGLAGGSEQRALLFSQLRAAYDAIQAAKQKQDFRVQAEQEKLYAQLKGRVDETNLSVAELESVLEISAPTERQAKLAALRERFAHFPARLDAMDRFIPAFEAYTKVKGDIDDAAELKRLLKGSGVLEYHILVTEYSPEVQAMEQRIQQKGPAAQAGDTMRWYQADRPEEFEHRNGAMVQKYNDKVYVLAYDTPEKSMVHRPLPAPQWGLQQAYPTHDERGFAQQRAVGFEFDTVGAGLFGDLTQANVGRPLAIVLDNKIISAPNINQAIRGGRGIITGGGDAGFSEPELNYLISTLNAGSLPAQLAEEPIREQTVGPQLGRANLMAGLLSCVLGLILVAVFVVAYYHFAGVVAVVALLMNVVLILGVMAMLSATFTLPSVAGIVLTIGIAVDANVLIFERLREEQQRGLSLRMALHNAYDRAWSAIVDSNMTTLITCGILYYFGTEEVKGFGLTLAIGLVSSLFTALFVTKTIFGVCMDQFGLKKLGSLPISWPAWSRLLHPNIDWMSKIWAFVAFSALLLVVGLVALVAGIRRGQMLDIEFASGTSVQFELKQPMAQSAVAELIRTEPEALPSASVVTVGDRTGDGYSEYEVVTPNPDSPQVRNAILKALGDRLKLERPSDFKMMGESVGLALNQVVLPIESAKLSIDGWEPRSLANYQGGVAIVLRDLNPPMSPKEIHDRVQRQMLQPRPDGTQVPYRDFKVEADVSNENAPAKTAVVLVSDPLLPYGADKNRWQEEVAAPMWQTVNEAIHRPAQLQRVTTFNPAVAGETQREAVLAIIAASLAIMAYIWLRFSDVRYGIATIVATVHDTLMVVGFIGISHFLGEWTLGHWLLVEPFRINLTLVAAVLTVMGYSMVDTIVVFDRIRENRGKFGVLSRQVVNDSINQTLSRTLLTGGTTFLTVFVMYLIGGPAIHGFTFVMLIGILIGTYSSIAIASPILLLGAKRLGAPAKGPAGRLQRVGG